MIDRTLATRRITSGLLARVVLPVILVAAMLVPAGCSGSSSGSAGEAALVVVNFNHNLLPGVSLNSPLVFTFSAPVNRLTVNSSTIEIWTTIGAQRVDATGVFEVNGATVIWRPTATSEVYPLHAGGQQNAALPTMPTDSGLNNLWLQGLTYNVSIPASTSTPNHVKSTAGRPMSQAFTSQFETTQAPNNLTRGNTNTMQSSFDGKSQFYRDTIRIADPYIFSGTASPPVDYLGWLNNPAVTNGENPLFVNSQIVPNGITQWVNRDRTGLEADLNFRTQLVPALTTMDMAFSVFPPGAPREERYISNLTGATTGRTRGVTGIVLFFSQPIAPDSFLTGNNNPKPGGGSGPGASPINIRNPMTPQTNPTSTPLVYTLAFQNDPTTQTARVDCTFNQPISQGWIHIEMLTQSIKGMPGGALEGNLSPTDFRFLWPVRINAP